MDYALWNTLHDGSISAISGSVPGDLKLTIEIAYLCAWLPTDAEAVQVVLYDCTKFAFRPYGEVAIHDLRQIAALGIELLSAEPTAGGVEVCCVGGALMVAYETAEVLLQEGAAVAQVDLEAAAKKYWSDWERRNRNT